MTNEVSLIRAFLEKADFSIEAARELEGDLDRALDAQPNDEIESLRDLLASFRPGGGHLLYDQPQLVKALESTLRVLGPK